jgi:hypothetical protein
MAIQETWRKLFQEEGRGAMDMLQKLVRRGVDIFERDSLLWGLSLREALIFAVVPFLIMLGMMAIVPVPDLFVWITAENSVMEWLQFLLILASSLIFARLSLRLFQGRQARIAALCLLIALGTFFVAGEEIAWGQHIFRLEHAGGTGSGERSARDHTAQYFQCSCHLRLRGDAGGFLWNPHAHFKSVLVG